MPQQNNGKDSKAPFLIKENDEKFAVSSQNPLSKIEDWLVEELAQILEVESHKIDTQTNFSDYGLDSTEAINISGKLEYLLKCRLSPEILFEYQNIKDLSEYLVSYLDKNASIAKDKTYISTLEEPENYQDRKISEQYYDFELSSEYREMQLQLKHIEHICGHNPFFIPQDGVARDRVSIKGRELINYSTYNYLAACGEPAISEAAKAAIDLYGTSSCASRLASGEKALHRELEKEIAELIETDDSIVYVGGHATNVTTISHLFKRNDLILCDSLSHNSIYQGCALSEASLAVFPHNDWHSLDKILNNRRHHYQKVLIIIEGVYSADGDIPNLPEFIEVKKRHKTFLMIDEAHSIGTIGKNGFGIREFFDVNSKDVDLWMGTLSKSFASCGGYIAGSQSLIEYLKYTAPGFVYSVGISPSNAASSLAAIRLLKAEPERVARLQERSKLLLDLAKQKGFDTSTSKHSPIVPIVLGDSLRAIQLSKNLFKRGINVPFMIYPTVPKNAARLRFFMTSTHTEKQIRFTINVLTEEFAKLNLS